MKFSVSGIAGVLKEIEDARKREVARQKRRVISELVEDLREATPVDTGRARDGWRATEDSIENDVEYIDDLNQGTSQQAPARFVEATLLRKPGVRPNGTIVTPKV